MKLIVEFAVHVRSALPHTKQVGSGAYAQRLKSTELVRYAVGFRIDLGEVFKDVLDARNVGSLWQHDLVARDDLRKVYGGGLQHSFGQFSDDFVMYLDGDLGASLKGRAKRVRPGTDINLFDLHDGARNVAVNKNRSEYDGGTRGHL